MEPCHACGASVPADATWCGQCYAVKRPAGGTTAMSPSPSDGTAAVSPGRFGVATGVSAATPGRTTSATLPATVVKSRWRKSATTFGPVGRILATLALVVPFVIFVVLSVFTGGLIIAAPVIWGFVIMPWGLRDTWRAGQVGSP